MAFIPEKAIPADGEAVLSYELGKDESFMPSYTNFILQRLCETPGVG
jgi:hypothetical protein